MAYGRPVVFDPNPPKGKTPLVVEEVQEEEVSLLVVGSGGGGQ
jgi:hypothetical protein